MLEFINQNPMLFVIIIVLWCTLGAVIEGAISDKLTDEILIFRPADFYESAKMNWFGSWFCFILLAIVSPFGFFIKLLLYFVVILFYIAEFIKWLFTVGRKDD